MALPDARIRLPGPKIDFTIDVGETGQAHDSYPEPGPARFDHLRMFLIGLLANQASFDEPIEFRFGSLWFDLTNKSYKFRNDEGAVVEAQGESWISLAYGIELEPGLTLAQWFDQVQELLGEVDVDGSVFSRHVSGTSSEDIPDGSIVAISGNQTLAKGTIGTDVSIPVGVSTFTSPVGCPVVARHSGTARVRMVTGLTLTAGDTVYLGDDGVATTDAASNKQVGVVFDASGYDSSATDPFAVIVVLLK